MPKISVLVSIYKVEPYLRKCLDSIIGQSFQDLEIILVDDGSPDRCPEICDEYAKKDARIIVIHQKNAGAVNARKQGLLRASGEYVSFVDGDDWLDREMYESVLRYLPDDSVDLLVTGYCQGVETQYEAKRNPLPSGVYEGERLDYVRDNALSMGAYYTPGIIPALWNKLIKRSLLLKCQLGVAENIKMGEDAAVTYPVIAMAEKIVVANEIHPYFYRVVPNAMSRSYDPLYFERILGLESGLRKNFETLKCASLQRQLDYYTLFLLEIGFIRYLSRENKKTRLEKLFDLRKISKLFAVRESWERVDHDLFDSEHRVFFSCLAEGKIYRIFARRLLQKISGLLRKHCERD